LTNDFMVLPYAVPADSEVVASVRAGDEQAFGQLFHEHYNGMCTFAARILGSDAAAEEVAQQVFIGIWEQHTRWTVGGTVAAYLYAAVRNRALNRLRDDRTAARWRARFGWERTVDEAGEREPEPYVAIRAAELDEALEQALAQLPPRRREAFVLRRQHHLSYAEIAHVMGITPKTVEIQIGHALKTLRTALADWL
jgi:RNA polymerase sigma-70 factor (ECF subfamily)